MLKSMRPNVRMQPLQTTQGSRPFSATSAGAHARFLTPSASKNKAGDCRRLYIVRDVPEDYAFAPLARKEISNIAWFSVEGTTLPKHHWGVEPFLARLRRWIKRSRKKRRSEKEPPSGRAHAEALHRELRARPSAAPAFRVRRDLA